MPEQADRCPQCRHDLAADVVVLEADEGEPPDSPASLPWARVLALVVAVALGGAYWLADAVSRPRSGKSAVGSPVPALRESTGARLLALVGGEAWVLDVDGGEAVRVVLPPGGVQSVVERRGGAVLVVGGRAVALHHADGLVDLGQADAAFASQSPGRVWLRRGSSVREVDMGDGVTTAGPVTSSAIGSATAVAAAGSGLVALGHDGATVLDARTGEVVRQVVGAGIVVGAAGPWLVTGDRTDFQCTIVPVALATGARSRGPVLPYRSCFFGRAALSMDGDHFGLPLAESIEVQDGLPHSTLFVVDIALGGAVEVPRTRRTGMPYRSLTWAPSGRWLFWTDQAAPHRIGAYRMGSDGAVAVDTGGLPPGPVEGLWAMDG